MGSNLKLAKELLLYRVANDPFAQIAGITVGAAKKISTLELMGTPEATVVTIVANYLSATRQGLSDVAAIDAIAKMRKIKTPAGTTLPLSPFIKYVILMEDQGQISVSDEFIDRAIKISLDKLGSENSSNNRTVPLVTAAVAFSISAAIVYFFPKWWGFIVAALPLFWGLLAVRVASRISDKELSAMVGDRPMTDELERSIAKKVGGASSEDR